LDRALINFSAGNNKDLLTVIKAEVMH